MKGIAITCMLIVAVLAALPARAADALKFRHEKTLYADDKENALLAPEGVACGAGSRVVVADTGNARLLSFSFQDGMFTAQGDYRTPQVASPTVVHLNSKGELFVLDGKNRRILHLGADGGSPAVVEPKGIPDASAVVPRSFAIDNRDNLYLLDINGERVLVLGPDGTVVRQVPFPAGYGFLSDVAVDPGGTILLIDTVRRKVYAAATGAAEFKALTGNLDDQMLFPTDLATDRKGMLYITDQHAGDIVILDPTGAVAGRQFASGWKDGLLRFPAQACVLESGELVVADRENNRVQVFAPVK